MSAEKLTFLIVGEEGVGKSYVYNIIAKSSDAKPSENGGLTIGTGEFTCEGQEVSCNVIESSLNQLDQLSSSVEASNLRYIAPILVLDGANSQEEQNKTFNTYYAKFHDLAVRKENPLTTSFQLVVLANHPNPKIQNQPKPQESATKPSFEASELSYDKSTLANKAAINKALQPILKYYLKAYSKPIDAKKKFETLSKVHIAGNVLLFLAGIAILVLAALPIGVALGFGVLGIAALAIAVTASLWNVACFIGKARFSEVSGGKNVLETEDNPKKGSASAQTLSQGPTVVGVDAPKNNNSSSTVHQIPTAVQTTSAANQTPEVHGGQPPADTPNGP